MKIKEIQVLIRDPTVQYGYHDHKYVIEIDEEEESIENVLRYIHSEHRDAMRVVNEDAKAPYMGYDSKSIPFQ